MIGQLLTKHDMDTHLYQILQMSILLLEHHWMPSRRTTIHLGAMVEQVYMIQLHVLSTLSLLTTWQHINPTGAAIDLSIGLHTTWQFSLFQMVYSRLV